MAYVYIYAYVLCLYIHIYIYSAQLRDDSMYVYVTDFRLHKVYENGRKINVIIENKLVYEKQLQY
jgi:hypothetical protein